MKPLGCPGNQWALQAAQDILVAVTAVCAAATPPCSGPGLTWIIQRVANYC